MPSVVESAALTLALAETWRVPPEERERGGAAVGLLDEPLHRMLRRARQRAS